MDQRDYQKVGFDYVSILRFKPFQIEPPSPDRKIEKFFKHFIQENTALLYTNYTPSILWWLPDWADEV